MKSTCNIKPGMLVIPSNSFKKEYSFEDTRNYCKIKCDCCSKSDPVGLVISVSKYSGYLEQIEYSFEVYFTCKILHFVLCSHDTIQTFDSDELAILF